MWLLVVPKVLVSLVFLILVVAVAIFSVVWSLEPFTLCKHVLVVCLCAWESSVVGKKRVYGSGKHAGVDKSEKEKRPSDGSERCRPRIEVEVDEKRGRVERRER
jgi:hypothetical protein